MPRPTVLSRLAPAALALALATAASPAHADAEGEAGRMTRLRINTPSSDAHPSYLGSVTLELGSGARVEYRWGGSSCPGQKLTEHQVDLLLTVFIDRNHTRMRPMYAMGEGLGIRCLVGFEFVAG